MGEPVPQGNTHKQPVEIEQPVNPMKARTEKSNLSEPYLKDARRYRRGEI